MFGLRSLLALLASSALVFAACKSHEDDHSHGSGHASQYPTCDEIIKKCHPLDLGVGTISECHVFAHEATSEAECVAKKAECLAACVPAADGGADGSASDASSD